MTVVATDGTRFSNVVKHEYDPETGYCREVVTAYEAAEASYKVGTVLGKITASGKYAIVEATATDGSETAAAVVIGNSSGEAKDFTVAATTDTDVLVLARGPVKVAKESLVMGASVNLTAEKQAVYDALAAKGIIVVDQV